MAEENEFADLNADQDEAPAVTPPAVEPQKPTHPETLVRRARFLDVSQNQIDSLSTQELDDLVFSRHRQEVLHERMALREATPPITQPAAPAPDDEEDLLKYIEHDLQMDPKAVKLFRKQAEKIKELEGTGKKIKDFEERETQRHLRSMEDAYDSAFEDLGADFEKLFGKGDGRDIPAGSKLMKLRFSVIRESGLTPEDSHNAIKRKVMKAAREMYSDLLVTEPKPEPKDDGGAYAAAKNGKSRITTEQWNDGTLAKPTGKKSGPPKSVQAAQNAVRDYLRQHDITSDDDEASQLKGVPQK